MIRRAKIVKPHKVSVQPLLLEKFLLDTSGFNVEPCIRAKEVESIAKQLRITYSSSEVDFAVAVMNHYLKEGP